MTTNETVSLLVSPADVAADFVDNLFTELAKQESISHVALYELLKCDNPAFVSRLVDVFQEFVGNLQSHPRNLTEMIAAAGFRPINVNPHINESNFPVDPALFSAAGLALKIIHRSATSAHVASAGSVAARIEQGLAYLTENPMALHDGPIAIMGANWRNQSGEPHVLYAVMDDGRPHLKLTLVTPDARWYSDFRFLVLRS